MPDTSPRLPFEIDEALDPTLVTGRAGVPLVIELFRQLGVAAAIDAQVSVKQRQRGLPPAQLVESLIALWTSGGEARTSRRCGRIRPWRPCSATPCRRRPRCETSSRPSTSRTGRCGRSGSRRRSPWSPPPSRAWATRIARWSRASSKPRLSPHCGIPPIMITPIGHHDRSEATRVVG